MPAKIEWTEELWNPVTGCMPVNPECSHCYAQRAAQRLVGRCGHPKDDPFQVTLHPERLEIPLQWRRPRRVFVCSMGDLFREHLPPNYIAAIFGVMAVTPQHRYQVLTERPERALEWFKWLEHGDGRLTDGSIIGDLFNHFAGQNHSGLLLATLPDLHTPLPLRNVQLGVTAEDQPSADAHIPLLLRLPASTRFVSCEPLLGPIDLAGAAGVTYWDDPSAGISWVTAGAETGPGAPLADPDWFRSIRDQCQGAGIPFLRV